MGLARLEGIDGFVVGHTGAVCSNFALEALRRRPPDALVHVKYTQTHLYVKPPSDAALLVVAMLGPQFPQ